MPVQSFAGLFRQRRRQIILRRVAESAAEPLSESCNLPPSTIAQAARHILDWLSLSA